MIMSSTCYNKRPLDDVGEDLEQREWKKSRRLHTHPSVFPGRTKHWPHSAFSASTNRTFSGLTPVESEDDDAVGGQHGAPGPNTLSANNGWLNEMNPDLEMADSHSRAANTLAPWFGGLSNVPMSSPVPSQLVNRSLNMNGGGLATANYEHLSSNNPNANVSHACPTLTMRHDQGPWVNRTPPSPDSDDGKAFNSTFQHVSRNDAQTPENGYSAALKLPAGHSDSMSCDASNGHHSLNGVRRSNKPKASIAMGYRADCEKCQRRVPGHYSHIVRV